MHLPLRALFACIHQPHPRPHPLLPRPQKYRRAGRVREAGLRGADGEGSKAGKGDELHLLVDFVSMVLQTWGRDVFREGMPTWRRERCRGEWRQAERTSLHQLDTVVVILHAGSWGLVWGSYVVYGSFLTLYCEVPSAFKT